MPICSVMYMSWNLLITDIRTATLNKKGAGYLDEGPVNFKKGAGCF